ncbi:MAG: ABC transporter permease subunit [Thermoleophilia bacterium]
MTVLVRSLRDQRRSTIWWIAGLLALAALVMAFYPTVRDDPSLDDLVESYPEALRALMGGAESLDYSSAAGYLNQEILSFVAPIALAIFAIGHGASAVAGEEDRGILDLLLAAPISRTRVVVEKLGALVALTAALGLTLWAGLVALAAAVGMSIAAGRLAAAVLALVLLTLVYGSLALLAGCATGRRGVAIAVSSGAAVLGYLLNALGTLADSLEPWRVISPFFHYADPDVVRHGLDPVNTLVLAGMALALAALCPIAFARRDIR